jgi:hypothetical protein
MFKKPVVEAGGNNIREKVEVGGLRRREVKVKLHGELQYAAGKGPVEFARVYCFLLEFAATRETRNHTIGNVSALRRQRSDFNSIQQRRTARRLSG